MHHRRRLLHRLQFRPHSQLPYRRHRQCRRFPWPTILLHRRLHRVRCFLLHSPWHCHRRRLVHPSHSCPRFPWCRDRRRLRPSLRWHRWNLLHRHFQQWCCSAWSIHQPHLARPIRRFHRFHRCRWFPWLRRLRRRRCHHSRRCHRLHRCHQVPRDPRVRRSHHDHLGHHVRHCRRWSHLRRLRLHRRLRCHRPSWMDSCQPRTRCRPVPPLHRSRQRHHLRLCRWSPLRPPRRCHPFRRLFRLRQQTWHLRQFRAWMRRRLHPHHHYRHVRPLRFRRLRRFLPRHRWLRVRTTTSPLHHDHRLHRSRPSHSHRLLRRLH